MSATSAKKGFSLSHTRKTGSIKRHTYEHANDLADLSPNKIRRLPLESVGLYIEKTIPGSRLSPNKTKSLRNLLSRKRESKSNKYFNNEMYLEREDNLNRRRDKEFMKGYLSRIDEKADEKADEDDAEKQYKDLKRRFSKLKGRGGKTTRRIRKSRKRYSRRA
jgi:hypothetical protein